MTEQFRALVRSYAGAIDESRGEVPMGRLFCDLDDHPELENDADLTWIIGWITGAAAALGIYPELLIERCRA